MSPLSKAAISSKDQPPDPRRSPEAAVRQSLWRWPGGCPAAAFGRREPGQIGVILVAPDRKAPAAYRLPIEFFD